MRSFKHKSGSLSHSCFFYMLLLKLFQGLLVIKNIQTPSELMFGAGNVALKAAPNPFLFTLYLYLKRIRLNQLMFHYCNTELVKAVTGGYKVKYHPEGPDKEAWEVDFSTPWRRIDMLPDLEKCLGVKLPAPTEFHTEG